LSDRSSAGGGFAKWLLIAFVACAALAIQLAAYPNHDVAWVLWGAHEMLGGAVWGRDIIEPNPPLAWYLSIPSAWLAELLGTPLAATYEIMVATAALSSTLAFDRLARSLPNERLAQRHLPTLVTASFLLLFPYRDFGQREHLMLIGTLPYVALAALRFSGERPVPQPAAIAIGIAAGLALALKPYFLAVPLFVEVAILVAQRRWMAWFRPETIAIGAVVGVYGLCVPLFDPEYLTTVVPLAQSIYWSFDVPLALVLAHLTVPVLALALTGLMLWISPRPLPLVLCAAAAGFLISYLLQHKGYSYHLLPVTAGAAIALAAALACSELAPKLRTVASLTMAAVLFQPVVATARWWSLNGPGGASAIAHGQLIDVVDRLAGHGRFLVVSVHPFPAFPTALYTSAEQVSRTNSQWFLPAVVQLRSGRKEPFPGARALAERNAREFILHDLAAKPDLVIVDTDSARHTVSRDDFDFLAFYREDPRFRAAWSHYREVKPIFGFRLFVRNQEQGR
jgi:hypothetical protein